MSAGTDLLLVGRVVGTHGLRGELKIACESDSPSRLAELETVWLGSSSGSAAPRSVCSARPHRTKHGISILMQLEDVRNMDRACRMRGLKVYARSDDLPPLGSGEYFLHDLIGAVVSTEAGAVVGELKEIWSAPASDVYVVRRSGQPDVLIPAVPAIVTSIDAASRRVVIQEIEGLLD